MAQYFDEKLWQEATQHPDWYLRLHDDLRRVRKLAEEKPDEADAIKGEVRGFFKALLAGGKLPLGDPDAHLDSERQPVDTVVVHHTSNQPGLTLERMNTIHLLNLYAPYYANPTVAGEEYLKGQPISSNHYRDGNMVFYAYHWFVRMDGSAERLLPDEAIGWHCGDWPTNCRSVAICLDNDYENSAPTPEILEVVAGIISKNYPQVEAEKVVGHREVNPKTICPGNQFLDGWKPKLIGLLK